MSVTFDHLVSPSNSVATSPSTGYSVRDAPLRVTYSENGRVIATFVPTDEESATEQLWYWKQQQQTAQQRAAATTSGDNSSSNDQTSRTRSTSGSSASASAAATVASTPPSPIILITCNMQKDFFSVLPQRQNTMNKSVRLCALLVAVFQLR